MTSFQKISLGVTGGLVASLVLTAALFPPARATMAPRTALEIDRPARERTVQLEPAPVTPVESERLPGLKPASTVATVAEVRRVLTYDLDKVSRFKEPVPRIFLAAIPEDLDEIRETDVRKKVFFKSVLPLVLQVNEEIRRQRERLLELRARKRAGERIDALDRLWLAVMAERYETERGDLDTLVRRVDVIPPSLALAQAAKESGWGTSRFARKGNALFGQWTWGNEGLVPEDRESGKKHKIKAFDSLIDSVRAYALNLNRHRAYREMRDMRADMRTDGKPLDGRVLAGGLSRYSERGMAYVTALRSMIDFNKLYRFDDARLSTSVSVASNRAPGI